MMYYQKSDIINTLKCLKTSNNLISYNLYRMKILKKTFGVSENRFGMAIGKFTLHVLGKFRYQGIDPILGLIKKIEQEE